MMPANAAIREKRRQSTPIDLEQMNVMKALTAAEYSRRQFVLNFAASRDTRLLIPGQKADAIKAAEEWVVRWLSRAGSHTVVPNELFKYSVDARLWNSLVGQDISFPFTFMCMGKDLDLSATPSHTTNTTTSSLSSEATVTVPATTTTPRPKSEAFLASPAANSRPPVVEIRHVDQPTATDTLSLPETEQLSQPKSKDSASISHQPQQQKQRRKSSTAAAAAKRMTNGNTANADKKRSLSLTSVDDIKLAKQMGGGSPEKFPFLGRLGRSFSRRMSSTAAA